MLEDTLRMYFSHPAVEGVLFWGFWDGKIFDHDAALATGANVTVSHVLVMVENRFQNIIKTRIQYR
jgi:hypothetical protein